MTTEEMLLELEALATVGGGPDGFATMEELIVAGMAKGKTETGVKKMVKIGLRAGRVEPRMVPRANRFGVVQDRPAYRLLPPEPPRAA